MASCTRFADSCSSPGRHSSTPTSGVPSSSSASTATKVRWASCSTASRRRSSRRPFRRWQAHGPGRARLPRRPGAAASRGRARRLRRRRAGGGRPWSTASASCPARSRTQRARRAAWDPRLRRLCGLGPGAARGRARGRCLDRRRRARPPTCSRARPSSLWSDVLRREGGALAIVARMPDDPRVN